MEIAKLFFMAFITIVSGFHFTHTAIAGEICSPTESDIEGPYYLPNAPFRTHLASPEEEGERIVIRGRVLHPDCTIPVRDALVEVWQTDARGRYHGREEGFLLRGRMKTDDSGYYEFSSVKPGRYRLMTGYRPAHIHFKVSHPDHETVITQLYFKDDPYLWPHDACHRACKSNDPHRIIALKRIQREERKSLVGTFNIILESAK